MSESKDTFNTSGKNDVEAYIRKLARDSGITAYKDTASEWAEQISLLSDSDVVLDEVGRILVNLSRARVISTRDAVRLGTEYLRATL